ncbi:hypothetical protein AMTR_s00012p00055340 [Amborella trichopoda]|uniref:DUF4283 domain-containing protein n=1 Tax=Amborella trichopoda TaxID=13333 RepID=W1PCU3_AMBTC|nr:hypothetical protein AMTR_s00012p00055340 [Amborella trichopoda]
MLCDRFSLSFVIIHCSSSSGSHPPDAWKGKTKVTTLECDARRRTQRNFSCGDSKHSHGGFGVLGSTPGGSWKIACFGTTAVKPLFSNVKDAEVIEIEDRATSNWLSMLDKALVRSFSPLVKDLSMLQDWATKTWKYKLSCRMIPSKRALMFVEREEGFLQHILEIQRNPYMPCVWIHIEGGPIRALTKDVFVSQVAHCGKLVEIDLLMFAGPSLGISRIKVQKILRGGTLVTIIQHSFEPSISNEAARSPPLKEASELVHSSGGFENPWCEVFKKRKNPPRKEWHARQQTKPLCNKKVASGSFSSLGGRMAGKSSSVSNSNVSPPKVEFYPVALRKGGPPSPCRFPIQRS